MKLYDLSPLLEGGIAVWPGDEPYSRHVTTRIADGASVNLSSISLSLHCGSHADAPRHFQDGAEGIERMPLDTYLGPVRLVTIQAPEKLTADLVSPFLRDPPQRLLIRCNPDFDPRSFPGRFVHFTPESADLIGRAGVRLIGLDAPSVDHVESKDLPCHHAFGKHGVAILENLVFRGVPDGDYELIALPLRISGGDASPIRAVLRERTEETPDSAD